jgi:hypothetical protein
LLVNVTFTPGLFTPSFVAAIVYVPAGTQKKNVPFVPAVVVRTVVAP